MKMTELKEIIDNIVTKEVKRTIIKESMEGKKEVYHVTCEGEPIDTFNTLEEAEKYIEDNKKHSKKELLVDKQIYESHADMIEKLDQMGQELEEKENTDMKNTNPKFKSIAEAIAHAKDNGVKKIKINEESYDVDESWKQMEEEEISEEDEACEECGDQSMEEELVGNQDKLDKNHNGEIDAQDFKILKGQKKEVKEGSCEKCGKEICECGGMYESKKKTLRLTETELVDLIGKMVKESVPGLEAAKKSHTESGKENKQAMTDTDKKMKEYLSIPGNNNNEFPEQNKKGNSVKVNPTSEEEEVIADERGRGLENLEYDHEPSSQFKDRLKKAIEGHASMGNSQEYANVIKTDLPKKLEKEIKRKSEEKKNEPRYNKEAQPTREVNETKVSLSNILQEEMNKMKKLTNYNKKTQ
jgi:hypothetical protein